MEEEFLQGDGFGEEALDLEGVFFEVGDVLGVGGDHEDGEGESLGEEVVEKGLAGFLGHSKIQEEEVGGEIL